METILFNNASSIGLTTVAVYLILKLVFEFIYKRNAQNNPLPGVPCNIVMADLAGAIKDQTKMLQKANEANIRMLEAINRVEQHIILGRIPDRSGNG